MDIIFKAQDLTKSFGKIKAIENISFTVERGQVVGVLGPNGSGKTTTLAVALGVKYADSGTFEWFGGLKGPEANKRIGALLETPYFYPYLNLKDNLKIIALARGANESSIEPVLEQVGLLARSKSAFYTLSLGMKQRMALASALLGNPEVLILDEPTNGLDPQGIAEVREIIWHQARMGKTIIMASHILDEVEKVCSNVVILKEGRILSQGLVHHLLSSKQMVLLSADNMRQLTEAIEQHPELQYEGLSSGHILVSFSSKITTAEINKWLLEKGIALNHLEIQKKSLESQFLQIIK